MCIFILICVDKTILSAFLEIFCLGTVLFGNIFLFRNFWPGTILSGPVLSRNTSTFATVLLFCLRIDYLGIFPIRECFVHDCCFGSLFSVQQSLNDSFEFCFFFSDYYCLDAYHSQNPFDGENKTAQEISSLPSYDPMACRMWFSTLIRPRWQEINMIDYSRPCKIFLIIFSVFVAQIIVPFSLI